MDLAWPQRQGFFGFVPLGIGGVYHTQEGAGAVYRLPNMAAQSRGAARTSSVINRKNVVPVLVYFLDRFRTNVLFATWACYPN
jgi:hypothetical protein